MFGRGTRGEPDSQQEVDVDLTLERDISSVEAAVDKYLQSPTDGLREGLLAALERLDAQTDLSDAYHGGFGLSLFLA